jgi:hypothetical protein
MNVQGLLCLRLVCSAFMATHLVIIRSSPFTFRLSLARFSPLQSKLFHPFLLFFVASPFASDTFAFVGNVATTN